MEQVIRLTDADPASLERRLRRVLGADALTVRVARFTYWYTGRPPVHEAILIRSPDATGR
jgi:hypothetical protein